MDNENVMHMQSGVLFSHKNNKILTFAEEWIELKTLLNEISWIWKDKYCIFFPVWKLKRADVKLEQWFLFTRTKWKKRDRENLGNQYQKLVKDWHLWCSKWNCLPAALASLVQVPAALVLPLKDFVIWKTDLHREKETHNHRAYIHCFTP